MKQLIPHASFGFAVLTSAGFASIGLLGGLGLSAVREQLVAFTPLLIALPAMNAMASDYATIITAHVGDPETQKRTIRKLILALIVTLPVSIAGVATTSLFIATSRGYEINRQDMYQYVGLIAGSLIGVVLISLVGVFLLNHALKKHRLNSDDLLIPATNTLASIMMLVSFAIIVTVLR